MAKTFGVPLDENVSYQLKYRKMLLTDENKNQDALRTTFINNNSSYVRMVSGVNSLGESEEDYIKSVIAAQRSPSYKDELKAFYDLEDNKSSILASQNILSGGTVYNKVSNGKLQEYRRTGLDISRTTEIPTRSSYDFSEIGGYVPMMGITDLSITSKSQYGTLREAEVKIKAWSIEQLDVIEKLYFKPGFTMLLEWGNSVYLSYMGVMETGVGSLTKDFLKATKSIPELTTDIKKKKKDSGNNYDAMIGKVINFSWDYGTDGSYDCSVKLMSKGEVIESVKSTYYTGYDKTNGHRKYAEGSSNNTSGKAKKDDNDLLLEIFKALTNTSKLDEYLKKLYPKDNNIKVYKSGLSQSAESSEDTSTDYQYFITIRDLLYILNTQVLAKEESGADKTRFKLDVDEQEYITFPGHVSADPYICGIPYKSGNTKFKGGQMPDVKSFTGKGYKANAKIPKELYDSKDLKAKAPLNILINLAYLQSIQRASVKKVKDSDTETSIFQLVKTVLRDVNTNLGGVNSLDLHLDKAKDEWLVVDRNLYNPIGYQEKLPLIDIMGLGSMVTSYSLSSKISGNMASMLAIAAQAGGSKLKGQDNLVQFNNGAVDRWNNAKESEEKKDKKEFPKDSLRNAETRQQNKIAIAKVYYSYATVKTNDNSNFASIYTSHREAMQFCLEMSKLKSRLGTKPESTNILLPIEMNLTMQGIAGLKIGEAFTITEEILPQRYRGRVGFVITGVSHKIGSDNKWYVDLKTNMFMLPVKGIIPDISTLVDLTEQPEPAGYNDPYVSTFDGETPNADKLRTVIKSAGFQEKGNELSNGGDITSDTLKIGTALVNTVKSEAPGIKLRFTSGNDRFHQNITEYTSRHKSGRALDFTIVPYSVSNYKKVLAIVQGFAAGSSSSSIRFKDEYKRMTVKATGVHFHFSWGRGSEGKEELAESKRLAQAGKIKTYTADGQSNSVASADSNPATEAWSGATSTFASGYSKI